MWLLEISNIKLHWFPNDAVPSYAILSHTWGSQEVSFQDIQGSHANLKHQLGYQKIKKCCEQAAADGLSYVWVDTCCIDKTNSSELSEAINSMFLWYEKAVECYAYLEDVTANRSMYFYTSFAASRWFTRGWTLQELLAPLTVTFFNKFWVELGTKTHMTELLSDITGIPSTVLLKHPGVEEEFSVAQKMSWAAKRQTTRIEDKAYCLLGVFGVSMPMVYGEGEYAFIRLQHEIMKKSTDQSLFAWKTAMGNWEDRGAFANSPAEFMDCSDLIYSPWENDAAYDMTNIGLQISLPLRRVDQHEYLQILPSLDPDRSKPDLFVALLNCRSSNSKESCPSILLKSIGFGQYCRMASHIIIYNKASDNRFQFQDIHISQPSQSILIEDHFPESCTFIFNQRSYELRDFSLQQARTLRACDFWLEEEEQIVRLHLMDSRGSGILMFRNAESRVCFFVTIGYRNGCPLTRVDFMYEDNNTMLFDREIMMDNLMGSIVYDPEEFRPWRTVKLFHSAKTVADAEEVQRVKLVARRDATFGEREFFVKIMVTPPENIQQDSFPSGNALWELPRRISKLVFTK